MVGLGPGGPEYLTDQVRTLMAEAGRTFLRTARHPGTERLAPFVPLDHLYEAAATFEEVYVAVVEVLVDAARALAPAPIVYAVPGSPLVAERTVELLRLDTRVDLTVVPGLSFLDLAWERLAIDPVRTGVRLVDAEQFGAQSAVEGGPYLVAQCWSQTLLSDIKLSLVLEEGDVAPEVVLLHHLGLPDEQVVGVGWWDLDRTVRPDHLTSLYVPELPAANGAGRQMARLEELVRTLRERCPWDRAQTHGSLMPHLVEESYEVLDALGALQEAETARGGEPRRPTGEGPRRPAGEEMPPQRRGICRRSWVTSCSRSSFMRSWPMRRRTSTWPTSPGACTTSWCTGTLTSSATRRRPRPSRSSPTGRR